METPSWPRRCSNAWGSPTNPSRWSAWRRTSSRSSSDQRTLTVAVPSGEVRDEHARRRYAFFEVNYLHLNHGKGFWTWFADLYAVGLIVLACTGIFIITGKKGLGGRGRWLLLAGLVIPIVYLVLVVWF